MHPADRVGDRGTRGLDRSPDFDKSAIWGSGACIIRLEQLRWQSASYWQGVEEKVSAVRRRRPNLPRHHPPAHKQIH